MEFILLNWEAWNHISNRKSFCTSKQTNGNSSLQFQYQAWTWVAKHTLRQNHHHMTDFDRQLTQSIEKVSEDQVKEEKGEMHTEIFSNFLFLKLSSSILFFVIFAIFPAYPSSFYCSTNFAVYVSSGRFNIVGLQ